MKKNTPSGSMSRRAFFLALLGGTTMAMLPQNALAQTSDTLTGIGPDDRLAISRSGNCIQIIDTATGLELYRSDKNFRAWPLQGLLKEGERR